MNCCYASSFILSVWLSNTQFTIAVFVDLLKTNAILFGQKLNHKQFVLLNNNQRSLNFTCLSFNYSFLHTTLSIIYKCLGGLKLLLFTSLENREKETLRTYSWISSKKTVTQSQLHGLWFLLKKFTFRINFKSGTLLPTVCLIACTLHI